MDGGILGTIFPFLLMFLIFYFLLIRPQQKRQKQRNQMLQALKKGDEIVTVGGLYGKIMEIDDETVILRVSENTKLKLERNAVNQVKNEDD